MSKNLPYISSDTLEIPSEHCCTLMTYHINQSMDENNTDACAIVCYPHPVRYGIWDQNNKSSSTGINFCPWCGVGLPGCDSEENIFNQ